MNESDVDGEFDSVIFASYLYQEAKLKNLDINATKLQKWLYICYGTYLAMTGKRLLKEQPKAWPYGPVFPRLHKAYSKNGQEILTQHIPDVIEELHIRIVNAVLNKFGNWSANALSTWTHQEGQAWDVTFKESDKFNAPVRDDLIKKDFESILAR